MSKKKKCTECEECMYWSLPCVVNENNIDYAKRCLHMAETTCVCGRTMKTKGIDHEQYCKNFRKKSDVNREIEIYRDDIFKLRKAITDYEHKRKPLPCSAGTAETKQTNKV